MRRQRIALAAVTFAVASVVATAASAQQIVIDKPVRAGVLVFFPDVNDPTAYYYAPTKARLATGGTGMPQFSFLRYVENVRNAAEEVREGEGGGIVHAVVELGASDEERQEAERELGRKVSGAKSMGPVIFKSGKFGLVSSFQAENGELATRVVGLGTAPILEGGKAAISIQLTKLGAKILWESFQTATPDVTFMFEMEMTGFRSPKRAIIEAELDRVYEARQFQLGVATTYVQAEITDAFDDLYQSGAIKLTQVGEDEKMEGLIQAAYSKLTELIFAPAGGQQAQQLANLGPGRKSALDRASELLEKRRTEVREDNARIRQENAAFRQRQQAAAAHAASINSAIANAAPTDDRATVDLARGNAARANATATAPTPTPATAAGGPDALQQTQELPGFAAVVTYEMKKSRQRGHYRVDLNKYTADTLSLRFDENIGDLRKHLDNDAVFRSVNLDDPLYRQREVIASLTGVQDGDFQSYLAFVSLQLRKKHGNGEESLEEVRVDRKKFNELANSFKLVYGWKGDDDRRKWQDYEYRTLWGFNVGETHEDAWQKAGFNAIALAPPFQKRTLQLEGVKAPLETAGVRSVSVQIFSTVGGSERTEQVTLNTMNGELSKTIDFVQPAGQQEYEYEIKWRLRGNKTIATGRQKTDQDILYLDELPEAEG
jgi:hypothetical protein